jgi:hypothetical protein
VRISVDHRGGATYLHVGHPGREVTSTRYLRGVNLDYDVDGAIVGVEVFAVPASGVIDLDSGSTTITLEGR